MIQGLLIAESLTVGARLGFPLIFTSVARVDVQRAVSPQPQQWTMVEFTAAAEHSEQVARDLAQCLAPGQWYVDFHTAAEVFVVFPGHIERYNRGDTPGRARALAYAAGLGIPPSQLDWAE